MPIDRTSPVPLYHQLKQILQAQIDGAVWKPGDLIPGEQELQERHGLSRTTVRLALGELVTEGRLVRQRGRGTFVAQPKVSHDPARGVRLTDYIRGQGLEPGWRVLGCSWVDGDKTVCAALRLAAGTRVRRIELLLLADAEPIGHHVAYLPPHVGAALPDELDDDALLARLRALFDDNDANVARTVEAISAEPIHLTHLHVTPRHPILLLTMVYADADDQPVGLLCAAFRGDRFKYEISSRRS